MKKINEILDEVKQIQAETGPPEIFNLNAEPDRLSLLALFESGRINKVLDSIDLAIAELFDIEQPAKKDTKTKLEVNKFHSSLTQSSDHEYGSWVFYPWSGNLVHFPPQDDLRKLRTSRNRNLIKDDEQLDLYKATVLIVGLSVGSSAVEMLMSQGIGGKFILVDMDIIEPSNLNRIKVPYQEVGAHKVDVMARRISETDPYIEQVHYRDGLNEENLQEIISTHEPTVIIDEMDDLRMKLILRKHAALAKLPVLMATDDGENAILDIERYDIDSEQQAFEGRIPQAVINSILEGKLSRLQVGMLIGKYFVGSQHIPLRMFESLIEVGKTIPSWPQLAGAATLSGVVLAYATKKIILRMPLTGGRHIFDLDSQLDPEVKTTEYLAKTKQYQDQFFS